MILNYYENNFFSEIMNINASILEMLFGFPVFSYHVLFPISLLNTQVVEKRNYNRKTINEIKLENDETTTDETHSTNDPNVLLVICTILKQQMHRIALKYLQKAWKLLN